ncbi:MAG: hypothetical protein GX581_08695 [Syntrophomonadaceae bacterium]|mgnify:CR=1 FL=1|jgi:hypothetical protein|nr:hypothetical protein [Syntrophomonadaceae bacterium]
MKFEDIDAPCLVVRGFWSALKARDYITAFQFLSAENKGFILGWLHYADVIDINDEQPICHQLESERAKEALKRAINQFVEGLPLDYAPTSKAIYYDDGVRSDCKMLPERYENVVAIRTTQLEGESFKLSLVLELVTLFPAAGHWRVDFFKLSDKGGIWDERYGC